MTSIDNIWRATIKYGHHVRSNNLNGLEQWNQLKAIIPLNTCNFTWTDQSKSHYLKLKHLDVLGDDDDDHNHPSWIPHHFLLQHGRIIEKNPIGNLQRLLQIAYNVGQYTAQLGIDVQYYTQDMLVQFMMDNYDCINTYINDSVKITLNKSCDDNFFNMLSKLSTSS